MDCIDNQPIKLALSTFLNLAAKNTSVYSTVQINMMSSHISDGVFAMHNHYSQLRRKRNAKGEISSYELIIADNSNGNNKRMAVLTAESVGSELVEMDCSGMREDVIIDLN